MFSCTTSWTVEFVCLLSFTVQLQYAVACLQGNGPKRQALHLPIQLRLLCPLARSGCVIGKVWPKGTENHRYM